jgi:hypothetical protein
MRQGGVCHWVVCLPRRNGSSSSSLGDCGSDGALEGAEGERIEVAEPEVEGVSGSPARRPSAERGEMLARCIQTWDGIGRRPCVHTGNFSKASWFTGQCCEWRRVGVIFNFIIDEAAGHRQFVPKLRGASCLLGSEKCIIVCCLLFRICIL